MNTEETTPGTKFKHLGGVFTLGQSYSDTDTLYLKDQNDEIYEMRISEFKRKVRDGVYELLEPKNKTTMKTAEEYYKEEILSKFPHACQGTLDDIWEDVKGNWKAKAAIRAINACREDIEGLGVPQGSPEDRSEAEPECGPAGTATPKESVICVEALEKEGWENLGFEVFKKGAIVVAFLEGEYSGTEVLTASGKYAAQIKFVSSMQDLRTLEALINGPQS